MASQVYFEDVEEGMEIPTLRKDPTTQQLVKYAGASGDYYQIHYDKDFALANGLPSVIIHGALKGAWLGQLMTDWIGEHGMLKKLTTQYRGMDGPGTPIFGKGVVRKKYVNGGEHLVECDIWLENAEGQKTTPGSAIVALPSRSGGRDW
jgi:acyl dehydratase